jgi:hypothetical protein
MSDAQKISIGRYAALGAGFATGKTVINAVKSFFGIS